MRRGSSTSGIHAQANTALDAIKTEETIGIHRKPIESGSPRPIHDVTSKELNVPNAAVMPRHVVR
jgi:hypothetical protein